MQQLLDTYKHKLLHGAPVAQIIYNKLNSDIAELDETNIKVGLAMIIVGSRADSTMYVRMKQNRCKKLGIESFVYTHPESVSENDLIQQIVSLNQNPNIHGILVQLPLPPGLNEVNILNSVSPDKDVDGFHTINTGKLCLNQSPKYIPCTPEGCFELIRHYKIPFVGKHIVMVGSSKVVGLPMGLQMLYQDSTVTFCNKCTDNIKTITQLADILIVACGVPKLVDSSWIKPDSTIIDVGIHKLPDPSNTKKNIIVGDVDFESVINKVAYISPVPGGVGPMTIAILMKHSVQYAS